MSFEKLLETVGDDQELKTFIEGVQSTQKDNVSTINKLETSLEEVKQTRDRYKQGNSLIKDKLGLENINEESLGAYLDSIKKNTGEESLKVEIENLKRLLETANKDKQSLTNDYEAKIQDMGLTNSLRDLGIGGLASSPRTEQDILRELKSGAVFEDGNIIYKKDGKTEYGTDGKPLDPKSKLAQLQASEEFKPYFKPDVKSGSGTPPNGGNEQNTKGVTLDGTKADRINAIKQKYNL